MASFYLISSRIVAIGIEFVNVSEGIFWKSLDIRVMILRSSVSLPRNAAATAMSLSIRNSEIRGLKARQRRRFRAPSTAGSTRGVKA